MFSPNSACYASSGQSQHTSHLLHRIDHDGIQFNNLKIKPSLTEMSHQSRKESAVSFSLFIRQRDEETTRACIDKNRHYISNKVNNHSFSFERECRCLTK